MTKQSRDYSVLKDESLVESVVAKIITDKRPPKNKDDDTYKKLKPPRKGPLESISKEIGRNVSDNRTMVEVLPDLELVMQILISSIISPKDMVSNEVNYTIRSMDLDDAASAAVIRIVEDFSKNTLKLNSELPKILKDILFLKGAYPIAILPENSIDDLINSPEHVSLESIRDHMGSDGVPISKGLLGNPKVTKDGTSSVSLESLVSGTYVRNFDGKINDVLNVTDNPSVLKLTALRKRIYEETVAERLATISGSMGVSTEAVSGELNSPAKIKKQIFSKRKYRNTPVVPLKTQEELPNPSIGPPLRKLLPVESVCTVHVPGDPEDHVGYYILLDNEFNPIRHTKTYSNRSTLDSEDVSGSENSLKSLLEKTREGMFADGGRKRSVGGDELARDYMDMVETNLINRLLNGAYGTTFELTAPEEFYRIMMGRALEKMGTNILFIPKEMMCYMAFDYDDYGIGRSLLDAGRLIGSIRAMIMMANTMGSITNSIPTSLLNIELDPKDPNPMQTVEAILHEFDRTQTSALPLYSMNVDDITETLSRASIRTNISGNPRYPTTNTNIEDVSRNQVEVNTDFEENLRKRHNMQLGVSPEIVDASTGADFATSIVSSNLFFSKRVSVYQDLAEPQLSEYVQKNTLYTPSVMKEIEEALKANTGKAKKRKGKEGEDTNAPGYWERLAIEVVNNIWVSLPRADTSKLEQQMEAFNKYKDFIDAAFEAHYTRDMFDGMFDSDLGDAIEPVIAAYRAFLLRKYLRDNNIMDEITMLVERGEDGAPLLDLAKVHKEHSEGFLAATEHLLREFRKRGRKSDDKLEKDMDKLEEKLTQNEEEVNAGGDPLGEPESDTTGDAGDNPIPNEDESDADDSSAEDDFLSGDEFDFGPEG